MEQADRQRLRSGLSEAWLRVNLAISPKHVSIRWVKTVKIRLYRITTTIKCILFTRFTLTLLVLLWLTHKAETSASTVYAVCYTPLALVGSCRWLIGRLSMLNQCQVFGKRAYSDWLFSLANQCMRRKTKANKR